MTLRILLGAIFLLAQSATPVATKPPYPGKLVNVGGHEMHFHCTASGSPTVVVEYGLGDALGKSLSRKSSHSYLGLVAVRNGVRGILAT